MGHGGTATAERLGGGAAREGIEEGGLAAGLVALGGGGGGERRIDVGGEGGAFEAGPVECAAFDEALDDFFVHLAGIETGAEILEGFEGAVQPALLDGGFHGGFADVLDGGEAVADAGGFAGHLGGEFQGAAVDVGREDADAHAFAFADEDGDFVGVADFVAQYGGHELDGVIRLEKGGLVADPAVGDAVAFVEAVAGEFFEQVEDLVGFFLRRSG